MTRVHRATNRLGPIQLNAWTVAKTAITLAVLAYAASLADLHTAAQKLLAMSPGYFVVAFSLFLAIPLIGGVRWWLVLSAMGKARGLAPLTLLFSTAMIVGQMLPLAAGDGVRALLATRRGYRLSDAVNSIFLERVSMMLALLLVVIGTEPLLTKLMGANGPAWLAPLLLAGSFAGLGFLMLADRLTDRIAHWRVIGLLARLSADTRRLMLTRWALLTLVVCLLSNLNFVLAYCLLALALHIAVPPIDLLAFVPLVTVATALPISLGGWGVREGLLVLLLGKVGVPASEALILSLMYGFCSAASGLPGLLGWWFSDD